MFRRIGVLLALATLTLAAAPPPRDTLDGIARAYVQLSLEAGERDKGYVDAYYGPHEWAAAARANPRTIAVLEADARRLEARARAISPASLAPIERQRRAFLIGQLRAAATRMAMVGGRRFSFDDEAIGLYGVRPVLVPLERLDPLFERLDRLLPGPGTLVDRYAAYRNRSVVPVDRLEAAGQVAIAECRRRTLAHIPLPPSERFTLGLARDKPWGAYNYYKGDFKSHIDINADHPTPVSEITRYGCHEGYPGHHVYNMLLERELGKKRGWVEYSIYPLFSPQSLIAEGSGNYGVELAFPGEERIAFEVASLYPAAGLVAPPVGRAGEIAALMAQLGHAKYTIAKAYLDGTIDRDRAIALNAKYLLLTPDQAASSLRFTEAYRSYEMNYDYGMALVKAAVEAAAPTPSARWAAMNRILSHPTTPADLVAMAQSRRQPAR